MTGTLTSERRWFITAVHRPAADSVLFCLPFAGAGASTFHEVAAVLPTHTQVVAVQLPGRENRLTEPHALVPTDIARVISDQAAGRPFSIYGHSLGAKLGYEVVRQLVALRLPLPRRLFVGGGGAPELGSPDSLRGVSAQSDKTLLSRLTALGGLPSEVLESPELLSLVLPVLRADFAWIDAYRWQPGPALPVPVTAFAGSADPVCPPVRAMSWAAHSAPGFRMHEVAGDHFFLHQSLAEWASLMSAELDAERADAAAGTIWSAGAAGPPAGRVLLWHTRLDSWVLTDAAAAREMSADERRRADRLRSPVDARRFRLRCVALRRLLRRYGADPGTAEYPTGAYGKPEPIDAGRLSFSLSHSSGSLLIGIADGAVIGADIETIAPIDDLAAVVKTAFTVPEQAAWRALPVDVRLLALLRAWTAKEATLKAAGTGLTIDPTTFDISPAIQGVDVPFKPATGHPVLSRMTDIVLSTASLPDAVFSLARPAESVISVNCASEEDW